uniref:Uncharacterized protein n=1 Tax=Arundo donax TaxID=35708 RepID=A0A0A8Z5V5_ARUDO
MCQHCIWLPRSRKGR